jgi:hypothetical protein
VVLVPREDEEDLRWVRVGWFNQERKCDVFVTHAVDLLPGKTMPTNWQARDKYHFIQKYGDGVKWCKTASYHMLIISGWPVLRIWTNAKHKTLVEISDLLQEQMKSKFEIEFVPEGTKKKRREFNYRTSITLLAELDYILHLVKMIYGLEDR